MANLERYSTPSMMFILVAFLAIGWALWYPTSRAISSETGSLAQSAAFVCQQLRDELPATITLPDDAAYSDLARENWSQTAWKNPTCVASPSTTAEVQKLVKTLVAHSVPFAIRSGGHSSNPFDANINTGILITTDKLNQVTYDVETGLAWAGPGAKWGAVYTVLDDYDVTVVGGRVLDVGVGGLTLGGGLSYLSDLYGLVCDNVMSFEVVLADGTLVEATPTQHSDLFWSLKGSSNNFGIVTRFGLATYSIKQVWGGIQLFSPDQMPALLQAYNEYQTAENKDLYANMVLNLAPNNATLALTFVYLKPIERPDAYAPFYKLTPIFEQTGLMTLHQLMASFPSSDIPRWTTYTDTFTPDSEVFSQISQLISTAPEVSAISEIQAGSLVVTVQPISENAVTAGESLNGGNALGLRPVNQTWFTLNVGWWDSEDDAAAYAAVESLFSKVEAVVRKAKVGLDYIFMNDANIKQPVIASYGSRSIARLRAAQKVYDPQRVWQTLVPGGQKIPK